MIRTEFIRFMQTLPQGVLADGVRRIANIVLQNLEELIPLSTSHGQRIKRVVELAQSQWATVSPVIQPVQEQEGTTFAQVDKLKNLTVGPFRGFARRESFDLNSDIVLIYGPNGTGKSSFCEALEYGLLGSVAEAESKRFRDPQAYLKNAYADALEFPVLIGSNGLPIVANESAYRFSFVEKNRIDSFSRIAAQAPAKQTKLISTLFGLDSFNDFVRNFTASIDGRHIDLDGAKAKQLEEKRRVLTGCFELLKTNAEELGKLEAEEAGLARRYREGVNFAQMQVELNGDEGNLGTIQTIETELSQPVAPKRNLTSAALEATGQAVRNFVAELAAKQREITSDSQQVSFKQLYEAVLQVQAGSMEFCPACKTPLTQVATNPYVHATDELRKLQHLAALQNEIQTLNQHINQAISSVSQTVEMCCEYLPTNLLQNYRWVSPQTPIDWWTILNTPLQDGYTPWQHLEAQVKQLEEADKAIDATLQLRSAKQQNLIRLRGFAQQATILKTRREAINTANATANQTIANFDIENAQLIAEVESEKIVVTRNNAIAAAYAIFVKLLNEYNSSLPGQLVADLGETVTELYNAFNRNDAANDQLSSVYLPLEQHERLEIAFERDPAIPFDALHVLSEGHIRCLGLAILMAKNLKEGQPLLIFDDPVNAIDDDHRESIRRTLFEDVFFADKQIILTCHGEEFFKDIQNLLSVDRVSQSKTFALLPSLGEKHIRIDCDCAPRNYIVSARNHLDRGEIREALSKSRQALESLTKGKVWRFVGLYGDGNLSIKMRYAKAPIELRNLTEQLRSKVNKSSFAAQNKESVLAPLEHILGINGDSREWRYLNKGTHDEADRAEFDRATVQEVVSQLELLDNALA